MNIADKILKELSDEMPRIAQESAELVKKYCGECLFGEDCFKNGIPDDICPALNGEEHAKS